MLMSRGTPPAPSPSRHDRHARPAPAREVSHSGSSHDGTRFTDELLDDGTPIVRKLVITARTSGWRSTFIGLVAEQPVVAPPRIVDTLGDRMASNIDRGMPRRKLLTCPNFIRPRIEPEAIDTIVQASPGCYLFDLLRIVGAGGLSKLTTERRQRRRSERRRAGGRQGRRRRRRVADRVPGRFFGSGKLRPLPGRPGRLRASALDADLPGDIRSRPGISQSKRRLGVHRLRFGL